MAVASALAAGLLSGGAPFDRHASEGGERGASPRSSGPGGAATSSSAARSGSVVLKDSFGGGEMSPTAADADAALRTSRAREQITDLERCIQLLPAANKSDSLVKELALERVSELRTILLSHRLTPVPSALTHAAVDAPLFTLSLPGAPPDVSRLPAGASIMGAGAGVGMSSGAGSSGLGAAADEEAAAHALGVMGSLSGGGAPRADVRPGPLRSVTYELGPRGTVGGGFQPSGSGGGTLTGPNNLQRGALFYTSMGGVMN